MSPETETRAVSAGEQRDDVVVPFRTEASGISGRLVRLGPAVDEILKPHDYKHDPVAEVLGEAIALTALVGSALKFDGKLILQTRSEGPLGFFVTNYQTPGQLRGYASFYEDRVTSGQFAPADHGALMGHGHLALTIDPGGEMDRYQGIVSLDAAPLSDVALNYFRQSEQLPTFIKLAVAKHQAGGDDAWHWRAAGLMVQHVSPEGGRPPPEDAPDDFLLGDDDDNWRRVAMLASTVEDHELLDPMLTPERLLYRLFHEEGVRVMEDMPMTSYCQCSDARVRSLIETFTPEQLNDMRDDSGDVSVTCEFCKRVYDVDAKAAS
ncbi:MAG: Hsp33 family molecular chaperone [Pseudomonadota bacterium]